jgi:hypothetical protein
VFNRIAEPGFSTGSEIPFAFQQRPTINVSFGDSREYPMLLDSGTSRLIFISGQSCQIPETFTALPDSRATAVADGKLEEYEAGRIEYATAPLTGIGGYRMRNVVLRVYREAEGEGDQRDHCGAVPLDLFRQRIVAFDNAALLIRLHERSDWLPPPGAIVLPLLALPQGSFIPARLDNRNVWMLVDTGFSGTLAVAGGQEEGEQEFDSSRRDFMTWRGSLALEETRIERLEFQPSGRWEFELKAGIVIEGIEGFRLKSTTPVLPHGLEFGGIIGGGLLCRFGYAFDLELGRFFIWETDKPD